MTIIVHGMTADMMYKFTPLKAVTEGISKTRSSWLPSAVGIASTAGRLLTSTVADLRWINRILLFGIVVTLSGIMALASTSATTFEVYIVFMVAYGLALGNFLLLYLWKKAS